MSAVSAWGKGRAAQSPAQGRADPGRDADLCLPACEPVTQELQSACFQRAVVTDAAIQGRARLLSALLRVTSALRARRRAGGAPAALFSKTLPGCGVGSAFPAISAALSSVYLWVKSGKVLEEQVNFGIAAGLSKETFPHLDYTETSCNKPCNLLCNSNPVLIWL